MTRSFSKRLGFFKFLVYIRMAMVINLPEPKNKVPYWLHDIWPQGPHNSLMGEGVLYHNVIKVVNFVFLMDAGIHF